MRMVEQLRAAEQGRTTVMSRSLDEKLKVWGGVSSSRAVVVSATTLAAGDASGNVWMWRLTPDTTLASSPAP